MKLFYCDVANYFTLPRGSEKEVFSSISFFRDSLLIGIYVPNTCFYYLFQKRWIHQQVKVSTKTKVFLQRTIFVKFTALLQQDKHVHPEMHHEGVIMKESKKFGNRDVVKISLTFSVSSSIRGKVFQKMLLFRKVNQLK